MLAAYLMRMEYSIFSLSATHTPYKPINRLSERLIIWQKGMLSKRNKMIFLGVSIITKKFLTKLIIEKKISKVPKSVSLLASIKIPFHTIKALNFLFMAFQMPSARTIVRLF
jgi:hypothetical protein